VKVRREADAVLAHDRAAGCLRCVPGWAVDLLDAYGDKIEWLSCDVEEGWVEVWDDAADTFPPSTKRIRKRGLSLVVSPTYAQAKRNRELNP
jgi:hypothetical protein